MVENIHFLKLWIFQDTPLPLLLGDSEKYLPTMKLDASLQSLGDDTFPNVRGCLGEVLLCYFLRQPVIKK